MKRRIFLKSEQDGSCQIPQDSPARKFAKLLKSELAKKKKLQRTVTLVHWEREFQQLITDNGQEEVGNVLSWYIKKIGDQYAPRVYSAQSFRSRYEQLKEKAIADNISGIIKVSDDARDIAEDWDDYFAGFGMSEEQLQLSIQQSMNTFAPVQDKVDALVERLKAKCEKIQKKYNYKMDGRIVSHRKDVHEYCQTDGKLAILDYLQKKYLFHPPTFLRYWLEEVTKGLHPNGYFHPSRIALKLDSESLDKIFRITVHHYGRSFQDWTELKAEIIPSQ